MPDSQIIYRNGSTSFVGADAVSFFRAATIAGGLRMYAEHHILPSRSWTPTAMLKAATSITGKAYKRGEYLLAADEVRMWAKTMKSALPAVDETTA